MMIKCEDSGKRTTPGPPGDGGAIPASSLHFRIGRLDDAEHLVMHYHYARRMPWNLACVGTLHVDGGLFGGDGRAVAACIFSTPTTRWAEQVLELSRLVRGDERVPLTFLIAKMVHRLRQDGHDLLVSYADRQRGHEGFIYQAASWRYAGCRARKMDGLIINGEFCSGRSCNDIWGTQSPTKLQSMFPRWTITKHYDEGKHLYWFPLGNRGRDKAKRLELTDQPYPKC